MRRFLVVAILGSFVLFLLACIGIAVPLDLAFAIVFGWIVFLVRVLPEVRNQLVGRDDGGRLPRPARGRLAIVPRLALPDTGQRQQGRCFSLAITLDKWPDCDRLADVRRGPCRRRSRPPGRVADRLSGAPRGQGRRAGVRLSSTIREQSQADRSGALSL